MIFVSVPGRGIQRKRLLIMAEKRPENFLGCTVFSVTFCLSNAWQMRALKSTPYSLDTEYVEVPSDGTLKYSCPVVLFPILLGP